MSTYIPPYARQPARQPVASARDYARAIQSGELFSALAGNRSDDPIVQDIVGCGVSFLRVMARAMNLPEDMPSGELMNRMMGLGDLAALVVPGRAEMLTATFSPWVARYEKLLRRWPMPNFNAVPFYSLGVSSPQPLPEFAEYKFGSATLGTPLETLGVTTDGLAWLLSRHALINGDVQLMNAIEQQIVVVFASYFRTALATVLEATDTMGDGNAFFYAGANNLVSTGAGAAPSVTTLDAATHLMAQQTLPGGQRCGLIPRYIVVPSTLAATSAVLAAAVYEQNTPTPFEVIVLPELSGSYVYYVADPNLSPTLALLTLGNPTSLLRIESDLTPMARDGIAMKAAMDFRIARVSRCGIVKYAVA